jgi:peroxiredoxin Q/BCP
LQAFDVAYFAASVDNPDINKKFAEILELDYPILSDPDGKVAEAYSVLVSGYSARFTVYIGVDGKVLFLDRNVNPETSGEDIAKRLEELGIPKREKTQAPERGN